MAWRAKEFSKVLNMEFAYNDTTKQVMTSDRVVYTEKECLALLPDGLDLEIHNIKKLFLGEII